MAKIELSTAAKAAKAAYQRSWVKRNPDKARKYNQNYWERKARQMTDPKVKARELYANGHTQRQIADILGISVGKVNAILNNE